MIMFHAAVAMFGKSSLHGHDQPENRPVLALRRSLCDGVGLKVEHSLEEAKPIGSGP